MIRELISDQVSRSWQRRLRTWSDRYWSEGGQWSGGWKNIALYFPPPILLSDQWIIGSICQVWTHKPPPCPSPFRRRWLRQTMFGHPKPSLSPPLLILLSLLFLKTFSSFQFCYDRNRTAKKTSLWSLAEESKRLNRISPSVMADVTGGNNENKTFRLELKF